jgi:RND family efflux transporter MFP subunit
MFRCFFFTTEQGRTMKLMLNSGTARTAPFATALKTGLLCLHLCLVPGLSACSKSVDKVDDIRPVKVIRVTASSISEVAEYAGDVRARVTTRIGFRVGGKIVTRKVDVGSSVKKGQILMQLDAQDQELLQTQALSSVKAYEIARDYALSEFNRYRNLYEKKFVSQTLLDSKEAAYRSAQANYDQSVANNRYQSNQTNYTTLVANADGVVTSIDAEVGQVVTAGTPVLQIANPGEMEIVVAIPEDKVDKIRQLNNVQVRLWAQPKNLISGVIREISPIADPVTRTFTIKISLPEQPEEMHLGMTAYAIFTSKSPARLITLPITALLEYKNGYAVWVVENGLLKLVPVVTGDTSGNEVIITSNLTEGQTVVIAGVASLHAGQKVTVLINTTESN